MVSIKDFLDPAAWVWFGLLAAALWHGCKRNFRKAAPPAMLALAISLCEATGLPQRFMAASEKAFWSAENAPDFWRSLDGAQAVVMCGGVLAPSSNDFTGANYSDTVDRFLKSVEVARKLDLPLVLGGGESGGKGSSLESEYEKKWLRSWGLTQLRVLDLGCCQTTREEAVAAAELARRNGWRKIVLVTSAFHMRRALGAFRETGLIVMPAACDFHGASSNQGSVAGRLLPSSDGAQEVRLLASEEAGWFYYRWRGWIQTQ